MSTPATLFPYPEDGTATRGDLIATLNKAVAKIYSASASATAAYTGLEELRSTTVMGTYPVGTAGSVFTDKAADLQQSIANAKLLDPAVEAVIAAVQAGDESIF